MVSFNSTTGRPCKVYGVVCVESVDAVLACTHVSLVSAGGCVGQLCSGWLNARTHLQEHGVILTGTCPLQDCYKRCNLAVPS